MINITEQNKSQCCGCNACGDVCAKHAITFKTDIEGFWYPGVNKDLCTDCGLCEKVCPIINNDGVREGNDLNPLTYILQTPDNAERFNSTSGCFYPLLAKHIIEEGGYVAGHVFDEHFGVKALITNNLEDLEILRNSKYLQSDARGFYKGIKTLLIEGKTVLVSGCPCQIAALKTYLKKDYANLITVDFTCMGIDSPLAFRRYIDWLEEKYESKVAYFKSKCKETGWRRLGNKAIFENGKTYIGINGIDPNLIATFWDILVRPSCYDCKFKGKQRIADLSIGDFWTSNWNDYDNLDFAIDDNSGTSYVMLNNEKAKNYFTKVSKQFNLLQINAEKVLSGNRFATQSLPQPLFDRKKFYEDVNRLSFGDVITKRLQDKRQSLRSKLGCIKRIIFNQNYSIIENFRILLLNLFSRHIKSDIFRGDVLYFDKYTHFNFNKGSIILVRGKCEFKHQFRDSYVYLADSSVLDLCESKFFDGGIIIKMLKESRLRIGRLTAIYADATIEVMRNVTISDFCHIGRGVSISDCNNLVLTTNDEYMVAQPIQIGTHCLIKDGAIIHKGASLGDETIIEEYSVVEGTTLPRSLMRGNPIKEVGKNIFWKNNN